MIDFPSTPSQDQEFTDLNGVTWTCVSASPVKWARINNGLIQTAGIADGAVTLSKIENPAADPVPAWTGRVLTGAELTAINIIGANPEATLWPDGSVTGSSDNGEFTKWPNGDLEIKYVGVTHYPTTVVIGSVFYVQLTALTFPIQFTSNVLITPSVGMVSGICWIAPSQTVTPTSATFRVVGATDVSRATVGYRGVGRWK